MTTAIRQFVKVKQGGLIQLRSRELRAGTEAEVIVLLTEEIPARNGKRQKSNGAGKTKAPREVPIARMTKQVRGDIAWAKKVRAELGPNIPWEQIKAQRGR